MRVGVLGGTFDPFHEGHRQLATMVRGRVALDEVWIMVAGEPPHKRSVPLTSRWHRFAMAVLGTLHEPGLRVSTLELDRPGPSYTVDTLDTLRRRYPGWEFCFIAGADALREITAWRQCVRLLREHCFIFVAREGVDVGLTELVLDGGERFRIEAAPKDQPVRLAPGGLFLLDDLTPPPVSGTELRRALAAGRQPAPDKLSPLVCEYIQKYRLYEENSAVGSLGQGLPGH
ncbi:MAG: nicotinate-nucleotide adenylyltransferase [Acidobacteriota bacterium]